MGARNRSIDWSKAGTRLRHTPRTINDGGNPDWNFRLQRWKTAEEYEGEAMTTLAVVVGAPCPICNAPRGLECKDARDRAMADPHPERVAYAGQLSLMAKRGLCRHEEPAGSCADCAREATA